MAATIPDDPVVYLIAGRASAGDAFFARVEAALRAGVAMVQMREKDLVRADALEHGRRLRDLVRENGALFIVNDDPHLAAALTADGVHVGGDDMSVGAARAVAGEGMLVGLSTHDRAQVSSARAAGADLIGVGPVFPTTTKDAGPAVGVDLVRFAAEHGAPTPFPIGGITAGNAGELARVGVRRAAVASCVLASSDPAGAVSALLDALA